MELVGGGTALEYGPEEEGPREIGAHQLWQDSVVLVWWDSGQRVGGMHRIGHEPNTKAGPKVTLWNHIWSPDYVFKRADSLDLRPGDRTERSFNCGDDSCRFEYTDHAIWRINEAELHAELHVRDSHTPVDIYPKTGSLATDVAPNHMDVGGRITGELTIKGKSYTIDGLAFRDHGWGLRDWSKFVGHRWVAGTLESGTSFLAQTFHSANDELVRFGCIIRDNKLTYASHVDVVIYLEPDGLTNRGGYAEMTLTTGETIRIDCEPVVKGMVSWIHGIACVDTLCEIEVDGVPGICDFETTNNALRGSHEPKLAINGIVENGLHPTA